MTSESLPTRSSLPRHQHDDLHDYYAQFSDCEVCLQVAQALAAPWGVSTEQGVGLTNEILAGTCASHEPIFARLRDRFASGGPMFGDPDLNKSRFAISTSSSFPEINITLGEEGKTTKALLPLQLVKKDQAPFNHPGPGKLLDPAWINTDQINEWRTSCMKWHGGDCATAPKQYRLPRARPTWLVDVTANCVVRVKDHMEYVALSYKWGKSHTLEATNASMAELQNEGALVSDEIAPRIPETIRNAIDLTRLFGERYLFVDSFCIIQDDLKMKTSQLHNMAGIYANANFTIVAAQGDTADHGLRGIRGISEPRELKQEIIPFGQNEKVIVPNMPFGYISRDTYFKRGWTFQEFSFSRRRIIFEKNSVRWECSRSKWYEDKCIDNSLSSRFYAPWAELLYCRYPFPGALNSLLTEYNRRALTYEEDALPAISGLLSVLGQAFDGGFLCGLPQSFFDAALAWEPHLIFSELKRRTHSDTSHTTTSLGCLPSWSWVGWEGGITNINSDCDFVKRNDSWSGTITKAPFHYTRQTIPICEWYAGDSPDADNKHRIYPTMLLEKDRMKDLERPLPPGWTRHEYNPELESQAKVGENDRPGGKSHNWPIPNGCGKYYFTHSSAPTIEFWYPVPIPDLQVPLPSPPPLPYLFTKTTRISLYAHDPEGAVLHKGKTFTWLRDESGAWAGILFPHSKAEYSALVEEPAEKKTSVCLVAISRGFIPEEEDGKIARNNCGFDFVFEGRDRSKDLYEFYNVLWVEWKDNVAYRRGYGRVLKDMWEKKVAEDVDLVLG